MAASSPAPGSSKWASEDPEEALPTNGRLLLAVVLASLPPFFLLSLGHYFSVTILLVHSNVYTIHWRAQRGQFFYAFEDARANADVFLWTEMAITALSLAMLFLSWAATLSVSSAVNSGRRLTPTELLSRMAKGVWREPSTARIYSTVLLLGYVLSLILVVSVALFASGGVTNPRVLQFLLCLLVLLLFVYLGVVGSVGMGGFLAEEGEGGVGALWGLPALMQERVMQGFLVFFLSLVVTHGFLVMHGLWRRDLGLVEVASVRLSPGPVLTNAIWMVGACGLFGYAGVLLQV